MKIFGKHITAHTHVTQKGDPVFIGLCGQREFCEGCGGARDITEFGLGFITIAVVVHNH